MHFYRIAVLLLLCVLSLCGTAYGDTAENDHRAQTVVIRNYDDFGGTGIGAGVIIARSSYGAVALTACHVVTTREDEHLQISYSDGSNAGFADAACLPHLDLAIVHLTRVDAAAAVATIAPLRDEPALTVLGHPGGNLYQTSVLHGAALDANDTSLDAFASECTTCMVGDSGGGVWDASGDLVGIGIETGTDNHGTLYFISEDITGPNAFRAILAALGPAQITMAAE